MNEITVREYQRGIKNRDTGNIGYTRQRKTKQKHNTIFIVLGTSFAIGIQRPPIAK
jgi:hypothetical protein